MRIGLQKAVAGRCGDRLLYRRAVVLLSSLVRGSMGHILTMLHGKIWVRDCYTSAAKGRYRLYIKTHSVSLPLPRLPDVVDVDLDHCNNSLLGYDDS